MLRSSIAAGDRVAAPRRLVDDHADRLRRHPVGDQVLDLAGHRLGLRALVAAAPEAHRRLGLGGPARLVEPLADRGDNGPGGVDDLAAAAKGPVEHDHVGFRMQVSKPGGAP